MVTNKKEPSPYRRFYTKDTDLQQWVEQSRKQANAAVPDTPKSHSLKRADEDNSKKGGSI